MGNRATVSGLPVGLSLHQSYRFQGGYGNGWKECLQCLSVARKAIMKILCKHFFLYSNIQGICSLNSGNSGKDSNPITYKDAMTLKHQFSLCPRVPLPNHRRRLWVKSELPDSESGHSPGQFNQPPFELKSESIKRLKPSHDESVSHKFKLGCSQSPSPSTSSLAAGTQEFYTIFPVLVLWINLEFMHLHFFCPVASYFIQ